MASLLSCGIVVLNDHAEILLGHVTGAPHWDIPKGCADPEEDPLAAALRETYEETGIIVPARAVTEIGEIAYRGGKALHLFAIKTYRHELDLANCKCRSYFTEKGTGRSRPEVDGFKWVPFSDVPHYCAKNMARVLTEVVSLSAMSRELSFNAITVSFD
jgi:predicted NUDIX family NTP pyrophosphohydrolase